ncbi:MAG: STAS-like domain-containing protein [Deltaproteobacteria bacterium]|nr:STAS-like domain-containing protein [Deltaproteobacteria bacterium]
MAAPNISTSAVRVRVLDFTRTPGARYRTDGPFSGEQFRDEILVEAYDRARAAGVALIVVLDGVAGYATSFLEEAFGGLARDRDQADVIARLQLVSTEEPELVGEVMEYMKEARLAKRTQRLGR